MNDVYSPPSADLNAPPIRRTHDEVSHRVVEALMSTRPWVLFFAVLGFLGSGIMVIFALIVMATGAMAGGDAGGLGAAAGIGLGLVYLAMSLVYIVPCVFLLRYARGIKALTASRSVADLEISLQSQKSFWKTIGLMTLVVFCMYLVIAVVGAVALGAGALAS